MSSRELLVLETNLPQGDDPNCFSLIGDLNETIAMYSGKSVTQMGLFE